MGVAASVAIAVAAAVSLGGDTTPRDALAAPEFLDEAATSGIDHTYDGDFEFFVGGGVAVFDCDGNWVPDLYLAGGENPASLYRNMSEVGGPLAFEAVAASGTELDAVTGAYPIDIDGDDHLDLVVLRAGENVLLRGLGDCHFERANERWSVDGGDAWTVAFSAQWESESQLPTLAFGNYVAFDESDQQFGGCEDNWLLRAQDDEYAAPTVLSPGLCTLSILFSDWSRGGQRDLRMTNDRHYYRDGEDQLWAVPAGAEPALYTRDEGWQHLEIWGMGIASQDVTGDGLPEIFITSQADNKLQTLRAGTDGEPNYTDIAIRRGATAHRPYEGDTVLPSTAWHAEFQDVNNDGFFDLYVAKGNVEAMPDYAVDDPNNLLLGQPDGSFLEGAPDAGIVNFDRTRGAAVVDLNMDGRLDLVEVNRREPVSLWRNLGTGGSDAGNWITVRLVQDTSNRDAVGAWVEVRVGDLTIHRELTVGGGHAGGQLGWLHFGVGPAESAEVRVIWPDGETGPWHRLGVNRFAIMERDADVSYWSPTD